MHGHQVALLHQLPVIVNVGREEVKTEVNHKKQVCHEIERILNSPRVQIDLKANGDGDLDQAVH